MWIIQGTLAWHTSPVQTEIWNQTSPQKDRWGDLGEIQLGLALAFLGVITSLVAQHMYSLLAYAFIAQDFFSNDSYRQVY